MDHRRLKPVVWPIALLIAGGLTARLAELSAMSAETLALYGMIKLVSDLTLAIATIWLIVSIARVALARRS